jgi:hypothetical protein
LLHELDYVEANVYAEGVHQKISPAQIREVITRVIGPYMWQWLLSKWEDKIFTVKFLFIRKTVRVKDLDNLWEYVFGPRPVA